MDTESNGDGKSRFNRGAAAQTDGRAMVYRGILNTVSIAPEVILRLTQSMDVDRNSDAAVSRIAAAIGEPARVGMLFCLMDNHARTSTELAAVGGVSPSKASGLLNRLRSERLVKVLVQGKHRYYSLESAEVANVLEGLRAVAGASRPKFVPNTPSRLRAARTCYDHLAGTFGVFLHDRFQALEWLSLEPSKGENSYDVTPKGAEGLAALGVDVEAARTLRRRFAFGCLDWSERRPHLGGAMGAAILKLALSRKWVTRDLDRRALEVTVLGRRETRRHFGCMDTMAPDR